MKMQLPTELEVEIALTLSPVDLISYCSTSRNAAQLCQDRRFQVEYLRQYGFLPEQVPGTNFSEQLRWLSTFNWNQIPGARLADKGRFIVETFDMLNRTSPMLSDFLRRLVQIGNPGLLQSVIESMKGNVHPNVAWSSLRAAFLEALPRDDGTLEVILDYYDPRSDAILSRSRLNVVRTGNLPLSIALSRFFPYEKEDFWVALENNQPQITAHIYDVLLRQGIDPAADQEIVNEVYEELVGVNRPGAVQLLLEYTRPTLMDD